MNKRVETLKRKLKNKKNINMQQPFLPKKKRVLNKPPQDKCRRKLRKKHHRRPLAERTLEAPNMLDSQTSLDDVFSTPLSSPPEHHINDTGMESSHFTLTLTPPAPLTQSPSWQLENAPSLGLSLGQASPTTPKLRSTHTSLEHSLTLCKRLEINISGALDAINGRSELDCDQLAIVSECLHKSRQGVCRLVKHLTAN